MINGKIMYGQYTWASFLPKYVNPTPLLRIWNPHMSISKKLLSNFKSVHLPHYYWYIYIYTYIYIYIYIWASLNKNAQIGDLNQIGLFCFNFRLLTFLQHNSFIKYVWSDKLGEIKGQWRSLKVRKRSNRSKLRNATMDAIFCMHTHIRPQCTLYYVTLASEVNSGQ